MSDMTTQDAARIAALTTELAERMNRSSDTSIADHARRAHTLATVHQLSFPRIAELVSRARVRLTREAASLPPVGDDELAILADDDAYRVSSSTVSSWVQAVRRLEEWGVTHTVPAKSSAAEKLAADRVVAASYRLGGRAKSGDFLAAAGVVILAASPLTRTDVAYQELVSQLAAWRIANRTPVTPPAPPAESDADETETETESTPTETDGDVVVPQSAETLAAVILAIPAGVAHMSASDMATILSALDAVYDQLTDLPAYSGARDILAAV